MTTRIEVIYITNSIESGSTFAVTADDEPSQVYVPASIAKACELEVGLAYSAVLVPNLHTNAEKTPWLCVSIRGRENALDPTPAPAQSVSDVVERLAEYDCPVDAYEIGCSEADLEAAWQQSKIVKVEARQGPDGVLHVLWAADLGCV